MNTNRYQSGSLEKRKTALGQCWFLRFRDKTGEAARPRYRIGLVSEYPSKASARRAADHLRKDFNSPEGAPERHTFRDVIQKYKTKEMPARYSTAKSYKSYLKCHIMPKWGDRDVTEIQAEELRNWLTGLPLATTTQGHIRDLMRILFGFAILWKWTTANPTLLFLLPGTTISEEEPRNLSNDEFTALVNAIPKEPYRTMVIITACLGTRCSETGALQWHDIDWENNFIYIRRAIVDGNVDDVKTRKSKKRLPLHPLIKAVLLAQLGRSEFRDPEDWVFASPYTAGEKPYHIYRVQQYVIAPAAIAAGLGEGIGWHSFRHSYRSWMSDSGIQPEVQKDLMRHADIRTTMNIYGKSSDNALRSANDLVVTRIFQ